VSVKERPAILDEDGIARDLSDVVADFGPGFFAGDELATVAAAVATPEARRALPLLDERVGAPIARPVSAAGVASRS
jgi:hypothetical protein